MDKLRLVVMGAAGRMGNAIIGLARSDTRCEIAGLVERAGHQDRVPHLEGVPVVADVEEILSANPACVIIDFTSPEASVATAAVAARHGAAQVIGTTGFSAEQKSILEELAKKTPIFWSPNMSVGVNVLLKLLPELVRLLGDAYDMEMLEIHHNRKKDAPSGTALRLAEAMAEARGWDLAETACYHREGITGERPHKEIGMQTLRGGDVTGIHTAYFFGPGERIELTHQAHSRDNFAQGALRAAHWLRTQKPGKLWTMQDMLP